jgi:hypothetical protein
LKNRLRYSSGLAQDAALAHQERDQQESQTAVAVEERVNGVELHMHQSRLHQQRQVG